MSLYTNIIVDQLKKLSKKEAVSVWICAKHVEAIMRSKYGTLDALDKRTFNREIKLAVKDLNTLGLFEAEALAKSYGVR